MFDRKYLPVNYAKEKILEKIEIGFKQFAPDFSLSPEAEIKTFTDFCSGKYIFSIVDYFWGEKKTELEKFFINIPIQEVEISVPRDNIEIKRVANWWQHLKMNIYSFCEGKRFIGRIAGWLRNRFPVAMIKKMCRIPGWEGTITLEGGKHIKEYEVTKMCMVPELPKYMKLPYGQDYIRICELIDSVRPGSVADIDLDRHKMQMYPLLSRISNAMERFYNKIQAINKSNENNSFLIATLQRDINGIFDIYFDDE